jgi:glucan 1,3-beta-glucosidase
MVLEPWITPSLFYRFLGKTHNATHNNIAMDSYTFCEALGPDEGYTWMNAHWETFIDEQYIEELAKRKVERVRLPIGDWSINQYGPYVGCMNKSAEWIDKMMDWCAERNISVLLDVHTARGSQNGFDNGGLAYETVWDKNGESFKHWDN